MPLNAQDRGDIIARRREMVARMRLRGLSQREIVAALPDLGCVNDSGEPWSLATINSDLKALQAEWRKEAKKSIDHHKARELAVIEEARRAAWLNNDLPSVLRAVSLEMDLLGTEAPKKTEVSGKGGKPIEVVLAKGYVTASPDDWDNESDTASTTNSNL